MKRFSVNTTLRLLLASFGRRPKIGVIRLGILGLSLVVILAMTALSGAVSAQSTPTSSGSADAAPEKNPVDVVIFVNVDPMTNAAARVAVSYNRKIAHSRVKSDIIRLLKAGGWSAGSQLSIDDGSAHPGRKSSPITTAALIVLVQAPQVRNGMPEVTPYLQAFQRFNHVEVNFMLSPLRPDRTQTHYASKQYLLTLLSRDGGIYRYESTLLDHQGDLAPPSPADNPIVENQTSIPARTTTATHNSPWGTRLILLGLGLVGVSGLLVWLQRRTPHHTAAPSSSRR